MREGTKKSRRGDPNRQAGAPKVGVLQGGETGLDTAVEEKYPDTRHWAETQKENYLEANIGRIRALVNGVNNISDPAISRDDLFQEAQMAFWKAYDSYDPSRGTLFTTYAHKLMVNAVMKLLRASGASKRKPIVPPLPYDTTVVDGGMEIMGGDNMEVKPSSLCHPGPLVEDHCIQREEIDLVHALLEELFSEEERRIFLDLSQGLATQVELAKELNCSQAKISMTYRFVKIRLHYELKKAGYDQ